MMVELIESLFIEYGKGTPSVGQTSFNVALSIEPLSLETWVSADLLMYLNSGDSSLSRNLRSENWRWGGAWSSRIDFKAGSWADNNGPGWEM